MRLVSTANDSGASDLKALDLLRADRIATILGL
jgi:hypothetical protein